MLGIAFTGGEGPGPELCRRLFGDRVPVAGAAGANAAALIAAADSGLEAAENAGFRPDWIVGDMDSLDSPARLDRYPPERVIRYITEKDYTDTELVLSLLWEKGCDETWLVGGGGGRVDHLFAIRSLFERKKPPNRWLTAAEDIRCLEAGQKTTGELVLSPAAGSIVSVFPLGDGPWQAKSRGLKWPLDRVNWDRGFAGVSNVAQEGDFSINAERGRFMVIVPL